MASTASSFHIFVLKQSSTTRSCSAMHAHRAYRRTSCHLLQCSNGIGQVKDLPATVVLGMLLDTVYARRLSINGHRVDTNPPSPTFPSFVDAPGGSTPSGSPATYGQPLRTPTTIGRERGPTRLQRDPVLCAAIDNYRQKSAVDPTAMKRRLPGQDGSVPEPLATDCFPPGMTQEQENAVKALLDVITSNHAKYHNKQAQTSDLLQNLIKLHNFNVFTPGVTSALPTDVKSAFKVVVGAHAPILYKYQVCPSCGTLRRCAAYRGDDGDILPNCLCGSPWPDASKATWIRVFSIIDLLTKMFKAPPLAQAMAYASGRKRSFSDLTDPDSLMTDIYDTDFYQRSVRQHPILSQDARHAAISIFLDGMLKVPTDQGSGTVTVGMLKLLNLPPHLRQMPGCTASLVVLSPEVGVKNIQSVLDVFADEIAYLHEVGVDVFDAYKRETFTLRGDLVRLAMDSKGITDNAGRAEPNQLVGSSLGGDIRGYTMIDVTKPANGNGKRARLSGKVFIPGNFAELPPAGTSDRINRLRTAAASLNPRQLLSEGEEFEWQVDELPPQRWSNETIRQAIACLEAAEGADPRQKATLIAAAHEIGIKVVSPWRKTGILMDTGTLYDPMHTITNALKRLRELQMGLGVFKSKRLKQNMMYESEINKRFVSVSEAMANDGDIDGNRIKELAGYTFKDSEIRVAYERGCVAHEHGLAHAEMKGNKALLAYRPKTEDKGLQFLKATDAHRLCGPLGKWLVTGLGTGGFKVEQVEETFEEVYFSIMDALNGLRRKVLSRNEAKALFDQTAEALTLYYLAFPSFEQTHVMHQVMEIARHTPTYLHACYDGERNMRVVRTEDHNPARFSATVTFGLQRYYGKFFQEMTEVAGQIGDDVYTPIPALVGGFKFDEDGIQIQVEKRGLYSRGVGEADVVIPSHVKPHNTLLSTKGKDKELYASLIQYYLTATDWNEKIASALHKLVAIFCEDGGTHPAEAIGATDKIAAWIDLRAWIRSDPGSSNRPWWTARQRRVGLDVRAMLKLVHLRGRVDKLKSCSIGGLTIRSKRADGFQQTKTVGSYFLAKVAEEGEEWYEVGRATGFIRHIPPGCQSDDAIIYAEAQWLIPVLPRLTTRSKLPMVVLDNTDDRYLQDRDVGDGLVTRIWPAHGIEAHPVCLLPLDPLHDVPKTVRVDSITHGRAQVTRAGLAAYTRATPTADQIKPSGMDITGAFLLAAVILPYTHLNTKFSRPFDDDE